MLSQSLELTVGEPASRRGVVTAVHQIMLAAYSEVSVSDTSSPVVSSGAEETHNDVTRNLRSNCRLSIMHSNIVLNEICRRDSGEFMTILRFLSATRRHRYRLLVVRKLTYFNA